MYVLYWVSFDYVGIKNFFSPDFTHQLSDNDGVNANTSISLSNHVQVLSTN